MATRIRCTLGALAVLVLVAPSSFAQVRNQAPQRQPLQPGQQLQGQPAQQRTTLKAVQGRNGESTADHEAATWLLLSNEVEVQLSQMAEKHAHSADVKKFAEMMVEQHRSLIDQLRQFAADAPTLANRQRTAAGEGERAPAGQPQLRERAQLGQDGGLPINQICYQMAQRTLNSIEQELSRKQGSDFDKGYMGAQIHEHLVMIDTLEILRPYASAQLQAVIDQAIPHSQQHLAQARKIGEQLWGGGVEQRQTGNRDDRDNNDRKANDDRREDKK